MPTELASFDAAAVGRRIRLARDRAGIPLAFAAKRAGLLRQDLALIERGRAAASAELLALLARLYGCRLGWLLTGTDADPYGGAP